MRVGIVRTGLAILCLLAGTIGSYQETQGQSKELTAAMAMKPLQDQVRYDEVAADKLKDCSIEEVIRNEGKGFLVTGPNGQTLRWFVDTSGDGRLLDRFCFYADGVEVYREIDADQDGKHEEFRWLGTEGLRWGIDTNEDGTIDKWKMISAEEVTSEVVRATSTRDGSRFSRLLISEEEIVSLGLGEEKSKILRQKTADARKQFENWAAGQSVVTRDTRWTHFGAEKPGIVPAGTDGSSKDVVVYENVVALMEQKGQPQQLLVGTMIQVGLNWRLVDLPRVVSEGKELSDVGVFFNAAFSDRSASLETQSGSGMSKAMERLVKSLQEVDEKLQSGAVATDKELLHAQRADVIEKLISASISADDRSTWIKQFADTVNAAVQIGEFPSGVKRLNDMTTKLSSAEASKDDIAYVAFRFISADFSQRASKQGPNFQDEQKAYLTKLENFVSDYPTSADAAEGMIQIALSSELALDPKTAKLWYQKAADGFSDTLAGKKAAGAITRLGMEGVQFSLKGTTLDGRPFDSSIYAREPVIFHYWATWCESCKTEMRALKELQAKYSKQKLHIVGINLDNDPATARAFLKANSYAWLHLYEKGGLDGDLAVKIGVLTLPVNVVVDARGAVLKSNVHWSELDGILQKLGR